MKLSIICQGPVLDSDTITNACDSYRQFFPEAEVIVSTWKGNLPKIKADQILQLDDPGPGPKNNNIARQIVGSLAGIKAASHPIVMRIRSDGIFVGNGCLDHWDKWPKRAGKFKVFEHRLIVPNIGTADPEVHVSFNISEWAVLGLKEDLLKLYDIPVDPAHTTDKSPEQYIYLSAIQKTLPEIDIPYLIYNTDELRNLTKEFISNNFVVLDTIRQYQMYSKKYKHVPDDEAVTLHNDKWQTWYESLG